MERFGQNFDELAEVHTLISNIVEDGFVTITLIFHVANLHLEIQILGNLA